MARGEENLDWKPCRQCVQSHDIPWLKQISRLVFYLRYHPITMKILN